MRAFQVLAFLSLIVGDAGAQQPPSVQIGDRVRLSYYFFTDADSEVRQIEKTGRLDSLVRDTVFLSSGAVPLSTTSTLKVSLGRHPDMARDGSIGLVLGAATGQAIVNKRLNREVFQTQAHLDARKKELRSTVFGFALAGGGLGMLVGKRGHEAWARVEKNAFRAALEPAAR